MAGSSEKIQPTSGCIFSSDRPPRLNTYVLVCSIVFVGCIFSEDPATKAQSYVLVCSIVLCEGTFYRKKIQPYKKNTTVITMLDFIHNVFSMENYVYSTQIHKVIEINVFFNFIPKKNISVHITVYCP